MSSSFVISQSADGIVNYLGAFFNLVALFFLLTKTKGKVSIASNRWVVAVVVWFLLAFFNSLINATDVGRAFKDFNYGTLWCTHLLLYYYLSRNGYLNSKRFLLVFVFLIVFSAIMTFRLFNAFVFDNGGLVAMGFNAVYFVVCLMPWAFLVEKKWLKIALIALVSLAVVFSQKRTAIVALALQLLIFLITNLKTKKIFTIKLVGTIILAVVFVYAFISVDQNYLNGGVTKRFEKAESDNYGNRFMIWEDLFEKYDNSNVYYKLFGHGCESFRSSSRYHLTAHNDYLETLYDYGLVSLIVLFMFLVFLTGKIKRILNNNRQIGVAYLTSLTAFFTLTTSSHLLFIHPCAIVFITCIWGYSIGRVEYDNDLLIANIRNLNSVQNEIDKKSKRISLESC